MTDALAERGANPVNVVVDDEALPEVHYFSIFLVPMKLSSTRKSFESGLQVSRTSAEVLPYSVDEGWPWVVEEIKAAHHPLITSVLTLCFGLFLRLAYGKIVDGEFSRVEFFTDATNTWS